MRNKGLKYETSHLEICTIASKINVTSKGVYLPISNSILAVANLLAHNNISQICYCGQLFLLQSVAVSFCDNLWGNIYLLAMVYIKIPSSWCTNIHKTTNNAFIFHFYFYFFLLLKLYFLLLTAELNIYSLQFSFQNMY